MAVRSYDPQAFLFRDPTTNKGHVVYDWRRRCWIEPSKARGWRFPLYSGRWICRSIAYIDGRMDSGRA